MDEIDQKLEKVVSTIPGAKEMMAIPGLGAATVTMILSETGDLTQYSHPQQLVNLAGLSLRENSSGQFKGQTTIMKRGRSKLRKSLYSPFGLMTQ